MKNSFIFKIISILSSWKKCHTINTQTSHNCYWLIIKPYNSAVTLQWIFFGFLTFAEQDVVGQGEEGWHGAIHGWLQYSLGIIHGCLHSSSIRHSPLWQILLHLCIPHFNIWLQRSPQEMSVRWQGILLRSWKMNRRRWQLTVKVINGNLKVLLLFHTFICHFPYKNLNTKQSWVKEWFLFYTIVQYSSWLNAYFSNLITLNSNSSNILHFIEDTKI